MGLFTLRERDRVRIVIRVSQDFVFFGVTEAGEDFITEWLLIWLEEFFIEHMGVASELISFDH
jgi:hypothetical protein